MSECRNSPDALKFLDAALQHEVATIEPDPVMARHNERDARKKAEKANRRIKTPEDLPEGAKARFLIRNREQTADLIDTYENARAIHAHAQHDRLSLCTDAECLDLAIDMTETVRANNSIERSLAHQMAAAHRQALWLIQRGNDLIRLAHCQGSADRMAQMNVEGVRLLNCSARMMSAFGGAADALVKLRTGGQQRVTVVHQHVQVAGGSVAVAGHLEAEAGRRR